MIIITSLFLVIYISWTYFNYNTINLSLAFLIIYIAWTYFNYNAINLSLAYIVSSDPTNMNDGTLNSLTVI